MLLLRRAVAALRARDHLVWLLAPRAPGSALLGPGPSEVAELIAWEATEVGRLLAYGGAEGPFSERLRACDAVIAYSRSRELVAALTPLVPRLLRLDPEPAPGSGHASCWLARPVRDLGADPDPAPPTLRATPPEAVAAGPLLERLPARFLAVHPGSGSPAKNWPAERFASFVRAWSGTRPWLLVEGPADQAEADPLRELEGAVSARCLPPRLLGAVLAHAGLYLGNDSGVSHLAAAWGAPSLVLFGLTDPAVWCPLGPRVRAVFGPDRRLSAIGLEQVLAAARELVA